MDMTGRLEFISGGWSMHDEATTHYNSMIDQHSFGAEFLSSEFGDCARTKIGWQIDPFGHSREVASLFAQVSSFFSPQLSVSGENMDHILNASLSSRWALMDYFLDERIIKIFNTVFQHRVWR